MRACGKNNTTKKLFTKTKKTNPINVHWENYEKFELFKSGSSKLIKLIQNFLILAYTSFLAKNIEALSWKQKNKGIWRTNLYEKPRYVGKEKKSYVFNLKIKIVKFLIG